MPRLFSIPEEDNLKTKEDFKLEVHQPLDDIEEYRNLELPVFGNEHIDTSSLFLNSSEDDDLNDDDINDDDGEDDFEDEEDDYYENDEEEDEFEEEPDEEDFYEEDFDFDEEEDDDLFEDEDQYN